MAAQKPESLGETKLRVEAVKDVGGNWQLLLPGVTQDAAKATEKKNDREMLLKFHLIAEMKVKHIDSRKVIDYCGVLGVGRDV